MMLTEKSERPSSSRMRFSTLGAHREGLFWPAVFRNWGVAQPSEFRSHGKWIFPTLVKRKRGLSSLYFMVKSLCYKIRTRQFNIFI